MKITPSQHTRNHFTHGSAAESGFRPQPNQPVFIYHAPIWSRPFVTRATTIEEVGHNLWRVHCDGEATDRTHLRFIHSEWQVDPDRMLASLMDHFRATLQPELLIDEFPLDAGGTRGCLDR